MRCIRVIKCVKLYFHCRNTLVVYRLQAVFTNNLIEKQQFLSSFPQYLR